MPDTRAMSVAIGLPRKPSRESGETSIPNNSPPPWLDSTTAPNLLLNSQHWERISLRSDLGFNKEACVGPSGLVSPATLTLRMRLVSLSPDTPCQVIARQDTALLLARALASSFSDCAPNAVFPSG